jgi:hypothetical protein
MACFTLPTLKPFCVSGASPQSSAAERPIASCRLKRELAGGMGRTLTGVFVKTLKSPPTGRTEVADYG